MNPGQSNEFSEKPNLEGNMHASQTNQGNQNVQTSQQQPLKKKNRTLQYYKFLFYSIKMEIKSKEIVNLIKISNQGDIILWILSLIVYIATPKDFPKIQDGETAVKYKNSFIWIHIVHVIRGGIGIFILLKLPKSFQVVEAMKGIPENKLENRIFNDLVRETIKDQVLKPVESKKIFFYVYAGLTFFNLTFDIIDFFVVLASLDKATSDAKAVLLTYLMIAFLYMVIDCSYLFWAGTLAYVFPPAYYLPIQDAFSGTVGKVMKRFKIGKPKTDIKSEAEAQNQKEPENLPQVRDIIAGDNGNLSQQGQTHNEINENDVRIDL